MNKTDLHKFLMENRFVVCPQRKGSRSDEKWYRWEGARSDIDHFVVTFHKSGLNGFSVFMGMSHPGVLQKLKDISPVLLGFLAPRYRRDPYLLSYPSWQKFDAGRHLGWEFYTLRNEEGSQTWRAEATRLMKEFILPEFEKVGTADSLAKFLLRNDEPFEWDITHPVLRMAEVILLAQEAGWDKDQTRKMVQPYRELLERDRSIIPSEAPTIFERLLEI
jgi:hypothetical protein